MHDKLDEKNIELRLRNIELHLVNLILPLQTINNLESLTRNPILIDDRKLIKTINIFRETVCDFIRMIKSEEYFKYVEVIQDSKKSLDSLINEFKSSLEEHNKTLSEIKYIGKKVHEIKEDLQEIKKKGVKNIVEVKVVGENKEKELINGITKEIAYQKIKTVLTTFEATIFFKSWGLGCNPQSYVQLAKEYNYSAGYIGAVSRKALRKVIIKIPCEYIEATKNENLIRNQQAHKL